MMINAEEEKQLLDQLGVVGSAQGTHYQQTVEFGMHTHTHTHACSHKHTHASPGLDASITTLRVTSDEVVILFFLFCFILPFF